MNAPVLSICIPTYNRAPFLESLLTLAAKSWDFSFPYEIVLSDNASTDATAEIVQRFIALGMPISYYRQEVNKSAGPNCMAAFHRARGRYVMFLADDDRLVTDGLESAVAFLQGHPELCAVYAPWELYDDINQRVSGHFYTVDQDVIFALGQELDLLKFVITRHIFPEHMIYRADMARILLSEPPFCYFAFSHLAHAIGRASIAFLQRPYYRSIVVSAIVRDRSRLGHVRAMSEWDVYRGGLEYFVYVMLKRRGVTPSPEIQSELRRQIDAFVHMRMQVAFRLWRERQDFVRAYELAVRLHFLDPAGVGKTADVAELQMLASAQALARFANHVAGVERIVVADPEAIAPVLRMLGLDEAISVTPPIESPDEATADSSVVFLASEADREAALLRGYPPGLIISQQDLNAGFHLV
jgi:glycosyltransferase involved in cell wall biosynthesis